MIARIRTALPRGGTLTGQQWQRRHRLLTGVFIGHIVVLAALGLVVGEPPLHVAAELVPLLGALVLAGQARLQPVVRESVLAFGLLFCSALLIHFAGGITEAHFHFFVVLPLVALYQRWQPLLVAIGFVVVHHLGMAAIAPELLFNTEIAVAMPFTFVIVHAVFVLMAIAVLVAFWKLAEDAVVLADEANRRRLADQQRQAAEEAAALESERAAQAARMARREADARVVEAMITELVGGTQEASHHVAEVTTVVAELSDAAAAIAEEARASTDVADRTVGASVQATDAADRLLASTAEIDEIVSFITQVAQRTNLLALNATIEAARAGESGKGFAVVADEVKQLATRTNEATERISDRVAVMVDDAQATAAALAEVRGIVGDIADRQQRITSSAEQQRQGARIAVENTDATTSTVATIAREISQLAATIQRQRDLDASTDRTDRTDRTDASDLGADGSSPTGGGTRTEVAWSAGAAATPSTPPTPPGAARFLDHPQLAAK